MYTLNESAIEKYLAQIVALAVSRPSPAMDRLVVDFCQRSLRLACKVCPMQGQDLLSALATSSYFDPFPSQISWWLQAYENDGRAAPEALRNLRKKCEEAALNGTYFSIYSFYVLCATDADATDPRWLQASGPLHFESCLQTRV